MIDLSQFERGLIREVEVLVGEYSFVVGGAKLVKVKIWRTSSNRPGSQYHFTLSHYFHGPKQGGPYMPSAPEAESEEGALRRAIDALTWFCPSNAEIDGSIREEWFVENENF